MDTLRTGLETNLNRVREIDVEVQNRKEVLVRKCRGLLHPHHHQQQQQQQRKQEKGEDAAAAAADAEKPREAQPQAHFVDTEAVEGIAREFHQLINRSEDKVHIAGQTYDLVDMHTCRLDKALRSLEEELRSQRLMASLYDPKHAPVASTSSAAAAGRSGSLGNLGGGRGRGGSTSKQGRAKRSLDGKLKAKASVCPPIDSAPAQLPAGFIEMKVDPNEPTYCFCNRVSFGEMVACDGDDCPWEWFHIACVGILPHNMPKGKWYCPECRKNK